MDIAELLNETLNSKIADSSSPMDQLKNHLYAAEAKAKRQTEIEAIELFLKHPRIRDLPDDQKKYLVFHVKSASVRYGTPSVELDLPGHRLIEYVNYTFYTKRKMVTSRWIRKDKVSFVQTNTSDFIEVLRIASEL